MLGGIEFDCVSQYSQIILCGGFLGLLYVVLKCRQDDGGQDAQNSDYYQYFYQRECLFHFPVIPGHRPILQHFNIV